MSTLYNMNKLVTIKLLTIFAMSTCHIVVDPGSRGPVDASQTAKIFE
jgi:hypothetical protein